jgi:two-component system LytT family response regulator
MVVDDEPPARDLIVTLLRDEPDVEIVGECSNGRDAVATISRVEPDLVFLDVQMPGLDGFGVLAELSEDRLPLVVFVTAYDRYAIRAFEVHALDYLLKPFEYARVNDAVRRARSYLAQTSDAGYRTRLLEMLQDLHGQAESWDRVAVREAGRVVFLKPDEIEWVEAEGNYVRLHSGTKSYLLRDTMNALETRLARKKFLRVNRSTLVNLELVKEWQPMFHGDSVVILKNGMRLTVSRVYRENLERLIAPLG